MPLVFSLRVKHFYLRVKIDFKSEMKFNMLTRLGADTTDTFRRRRCPSTSGRFFTELCLESLNRGINWSNGTSKRSFSLVRSFVRSFVRLENYKQCSWTSNEETKEQSSRRWFNARIDAKSQIRKILSLKPALHLRTNVYETNICSGRETTTK